jgi:hypothetical protein
MDRIQGGWFAELGLFLLIYRLKGPSVGILFAGHVLFDFRADRRMRRAVSMTCDLISVSQPASNNVEPTKCTNMDRVAK